MNTANDLPHRLKNLRLQNGYTQDALANELNITRQAVSRWENGYAAPDINTIKRLCQLYHISMDEFLENDFCPKVSAKSNSCESKKSTDTTSFFFTADIIITIVLSCLSNRISCSPAPWGYIGFFLVFGTFIWALKNRKRYKQVLIIVILSFWVTANNCYITYTHSLIDPATTFDEYSDW